MNPYEAPQSSLAPTNLPTALAVNPYASASGSTANIVTAWVIVFCLNLPVATMLGLVLCRGLGGLGMFAAIVGMLTLTTYGIRQSGRFAKCWLAGALCVAASQFVPYLHFWLGGFAVSLFDGPGNELNMVNAMICSLIVGGGLIGVSLALAATFYLLFVSWDQR